PVNHKGKVFQAAPKPAEGQAAQHYATAGVNRIGILPLPSGCSCCCANSMRATKSRPAYHYVPRRALPPIMEGFPAVLLFCRITDEDAPCAGPVMPKVHNTFVHVHVLKGDHGLVQPFQGYKDNAEVVPSCITTPIVAIDGFLFHGLLERRHGFLQSP